MRKNLWLEKLEAIYKDANVAKETADKLEKRLSGFKFERNLKELDESDVILITYADSIIEKGRMSLETLNNFLSEFVKDAITNVHILPFFPYTSDDGFSITDYSKVNPAFGTWDDISKIADHYSLMVDSVANHVSKSGEWFQKYLKGEKPYDEFFIECDPTLDYSKVTRPRALPLLTKFETKRGEKYLWTTFSDDQIDLNFKNPEVLIRIIESILNYVKHGARFIRLDAIGFIWKEENSSCMHLKETHEIIKLIRLVVNDVAPGVAIITETNVPQKDNISYFGENGDEAKMVYQFPLPPLVMHTLLKGSSKALTGWAQSLYVPGNGNTYFNFLSSHDGIGLRPAEGILSKEEQDDLVTQTLKQGGRVSYKTNGDKTVSPYEMNIMYLDAITDRYDRDEVREKKFIAAMTILLSLQGVPGIYIHSLLGSRNDYYGVSESGIARRINREKLDYSTLKKELSENSLRNDIFSELIKLLKIRKKEKAFSPYSDQKILDLNDHVFALYRGEKKERILVLINISGRDVLIENIDTSGFDLIRGKKTEKSILLKPYQVCWIKQEEK